MSGCVDTLHAAVYEPTPDAPIQPASAALNGTRFNGDLPLIASNGTFASSDGTRLAFSLLVPDTHSAVPGVLILTHVGIDPPSVNALKAYVPILLLEDQLVYHSYAVAIVNARGTGASGGCEDLGGRADQADAAAAVEWLAAQNWTNGRIGVVGLGASGSAAVMAAAQRAPHLAAIMPIDPTLDVYSNFTEGGAKLAATGPRAVAQDVIFAPAGISPANLDPRAPPPTPPTLQDPRVQRAKDQSCAPAHAAFADDPTGSRNAWAQERDLRVTSAKAATPMFFTLGILGAAGQADPWYASYAGPKRAYVWQNEPALPLFGPNAEVWLKTAFGFLDHELWGYHNLFEQSYGTVDVQDSMGRWRNETAWPPANATPLGWTLAKGGVLAQNATTGLKLAVDDAEVLREDPREDGGDRGAKSSVFSAGSTATHLVYRTAPLVSDVHVAGRPVVKLSVDVDRPNAFIVARLYRVIPDGSWILENRGVRALAMRDSDSPSPAQPGVVYALSIPMQPDDVVFRAGDRIGLVLAADDLSYIVPSTWGASTNVHYGGAAPSSITLPVIRDYHRDITSWGAVQPAWRGPRAFEVGP